MLLQLVVPRSDSSDTMMVMLVGSFLSWWYGAGWARIMHSLGPRMRGVLDSFSVRQLLRTLFAPWRRIITYPGRSLEDRFRAIGDNLFSRAVGFVVRLIVLLAAVVMLIIIAVLTLVEIVIWPLLPLAVPGCLVTGLVL
jgi:hypothetical protein